MKFGAIDYDAALNTLTQVYEISQDKAVLLLSKPKNITQNLVSEESVI